MAGKTIFFHDFHKGGLVENKYVGGLNNIAGGRGITFHETSGVVKAQKSLVNDGSDINDEPCKVVMSPSTGARGLAFIRDGHVWAKTVITSTWTEVYTGVTSEPYSAIEFNGYIYWTTSDKLHRKAVNSTLDQTWSSVDNNWQTLNDTSFHPMQVIDRTLYIGNKTSIASVDSSGTFTSSVVSLPTPFGASSLGQYGLDLIIGSVQINSSGAVNKHLNKSQIYRYPTWGDSFAGAVSIPGTHVPEFFSVDNYLCFTIFDYNNSVGPDAVIYIYTGDSYDVLARMPYDSDGLYVYPSCWGTRDGLTYFAYKDNIYSLSKNTSSSIYVLTPEYYYDGDSEDLTEVYIKSIDPAMNFVSIATLDSADEYQMTSITTTRYDGAYFETPVIHSGQRKTTYGNFAIPYVDLPSGTSLALKYDANLSGSWTSVPGLVNDSARKQYISPFKIEANYLEMRVDFTTSGTDSPQALGVMCEVM